MFGWLAYLGLFGVMYVIVDKTCKGIAHRRATGSWSSGDSSTAGSSGLYASTDRTDWKDYARTNQSNNWPTYKAPQSMSDLANPIGWYNPNSPNYVHKTKSAPSMSSLSNPMGWYTPGSPNYIHKQTYTPPSMSSPSNPIGWYNPNSPNYMFKPHHHTPIHRHTPMHAPIHHHGSMFR
jgi:hypothetical protein